MDRKDIFDKMIAALVEQDRSEVNQWVDKALQEGVSALDVLNEGLAMGLRDLGDLFTEEEVFLPELLLAADIVQEIMVRLDSQLGDLDKVEKRGTVLLATVEGDVHDIGKSLVGMIMDASGYNVIDAGKDVPSQKLLELAKEHKPDVVGLSSLLSTTMSAQKEFIELAQEAGIRDRIKVMVGGAPVSRDWARKIGADGFAEDASAAVVESNRLLGIC